MPAAMRLQDLGSNHPIVAISLQTLGHILRMRQQLPEALEAAQRCEQLRASQAQGPPMAAALHLQVGLHESPGTCVFVPHYFLQSNSQGYAAQQYAGLLP